MDDTNGHEFNLFKFRWMNDAKEFQVFQIVGWDSGEPHGASLFGICLHHDLNFLEFSILFINIMFSTNGEF